jgi:allophanate hydrolase subunit 1
MLGLAEGRPLSSQKTIGKSDRLLGELDRRLALPRRATPRTAVPAGSLAIAERQTAIYPQCSPGGWHLIGRCPWRLFDLERTPLSPLVLADRVRFRPIDECDFIAEGGLL